MYFRTSISLDSDHDEVTSFCIRFTDFPRKSLLTQVEISMISEIFRYNEENIARLIMTKERKCAKLFSAMVFSRGAYNMEGMTGQIGQCNCTLMHSA